MYAFDVRFTTKILERISSSGQLIPAIRDSIHFSIGALRGIPRRDLITPIRFNERFIIAIDLRDLSYPSIGYLINIQPSRSACRKD
jgi:hypothetical protein